MGTENEGDNLGRNQHARFLGQALYAALNFPEKQRPDTFCLIKQCKLGTRAASWSCSTSNNALWPPPLPPLRGLPEAAPEGHVRQ